MTDTATTRTEVEASHDLFVRSYGKVPNLFRLQGELPKVVQAEEQLIHAILLQDGPLPKDIKRSLLSAVARARGNHYVWSLHTRGGADQTDCSPELHMRGQTLASTGCTFCADDVNSLLQSGLTAEVLLDAILTIALGQLLCTVAEALNPELDFDTSATLDPLSLPDQQLNQN